mgnify:CR=1 FL=1
MNATVITLKGEISKDLQSKIDALVAEADRELGRQNVDLVGGRLNDR